MILKFLGRLNKPGSAKKAEKSRAYAGADWGRLNSDWVAPTTSPDSEIYSSLKTLRNRTRQIVRDNPHAAAAALRILANNVVGAHGIRLQAQVETVRGNKLNKTLNQKIEEEFAAWSQAENCDVAGKLDIVDIEHLIIKSLCISGEIIIRFIPMAFGKSKVPLALEIIEADQLAEDRNCQEKNGNLTRLGIEMDKWGRPVAYWLYPFHPGDAGRFGFYQDKTELIRVPASEILHLYLVDRPGQNRGVPWFHAILQQIRHLDGFQIAEIVAARANASVMGFRTEEVSSSLTDIPDLPPVEKLEPGVIKKLPPGEEFVPFMPNRPNNSYEPFVRSILRQQAVGLGVTYEDLSGDYSSVNYSSARVAQINIREGYKFLQHWLIRHFCFPLYRRWLQYAVLAGVIRINDFENRIEHYSKARFIPKGFDWVDPKKEIEAAILAVKAGVTSLTQVAAERGLDFEEVLAQRQREVEIAKELGLELDFGGSQNAGVQENGATNLSETD